MGKFSKTLALLFTGLIGLGLAGCGGEEAFTTPGTTDTGTDGGDTTGTPSVPPVTGTPKEISFSWPQSDAITNVGAGVYRRIGSVLVTDEDGNAVPDGTEVYLNVVDSILAQGTITTGGGDSITGSVLTDNGVTLGNGITTTGFDTAWVYRNDTYRLIEPGDMLMLIGAETDDKVRAVSTATLTATTVGADAVYVNAYPNAIYTSGETSFLVGASTFAANVAGVDSAGTLSAGVAATVNGVANFQITYPANPDTILTGCGGVPAVDTRAAPTGSADVYVTARVAGSTVSAVSDDFCFNYIAGGPITVIPKALSATSTVFLSVYDGDDGFAVPFQSITASVTGISGGASVTATTPVYAGASTVATSTITVAGTSGGKATVVYSWYNGSAVVTAEVAVTVP